MQVFYFILFYFTCTAGLSLLKSVNDHVEFHPKKHMQHMLSNVV